MKKLFQPQFLEKTDSRTMILITTIWILAAFSLAQFNGNEIIPKPIGVLTSLLRIVSENTFLDNFVSTFGLILKSMAISTLASLAIVYLSLVPVFKNLAKFVSKLRFLTYTGMLFVFTIMLKDGHQVKISLLLFGIIPYFVTSLLSYISDIPQKEYELCYTLKFNRWRTLYEVVIKGRLHLVLLVLGQNFAIAWMMINSVEGLCMSEGGLGTMLIKSNKYLKMDDVFAILVIILSSGMLFDYLFDIARVFFFPYTDTKRYANLLIWKILRLLKIEI